MEGICDMFIEEQKEWKQKLIELQIGMNKLQLYEMDHGQEGVLIGEAVWHGGKVLS